MATSNYLKKLEEIKAKANGGSGGNSSPSGSSTTSSQSVLDRIKAKSNGASAAPESDRTEEKPSFTTKGNEGYNKYLEDMKASTTDKEDEKWWEKLGRYLSGSTPDTSLPMATASQAASDIRADDSYRRPGAEWSVQQKSKFGELYLTDPEAAYKYAEQANSENNKRKEEIEANKIKESATENFGAGLGNTLGAIATAPLGAADYLKDLIYASEGREITSDGTISPFEYSQAVTGGISEHLNEKGGTLDEDIPIIGGKGWGDVYGLGTSIAQSMASAYTLGGVGTLISYFGQGAAAGVDDALSRGATDEQALLYGTAVGAFEGIAEKIGIDNLFKLGSASTVKGLLKNILKQAGAEGLEEGATSIMSNIADKIIMQDKSVFNQTVAELMSQGMSEKEAIKAAWWDSVEGIIFDTVAGAVSGSVSGSIHSTANTIKSNRQASKLYGDQAQALVSDALGSQFSAVKEVGQKYQDKLDSGKSLSGWNLNELIDVTDKSKLKSSIMHRLGELGETTDGTVVTDVLIKYAMGEELSSKDYNVLNNSDYGHQVLGGLNKENIMSGGLSNKWAENIGTRQVSPEVYNRSNATQQTPKKSKVNVLPSDDDENKMEISAEDVKTTITKDGKSVEVKVDKIESIEGDEISLKLDNGEVVNASDVDFGGQIGLVYQAAKDMTSRVGGFGIDAANVFVKGYTTDTKLTAAEYVHGFSDAYRFGKMGYPASELERGVYTSKLSKEQRETAYNFGKAFGNEEIAKKSEKIVSTVTINDGNNSKMASKVKKGIVHFDGSVAGKSLTERQKASLKGLGVVAESMGIDIHVFESKLVNGKRVGENGSYDPDTKEIRIDLHAGVKGDALMLFTASHELTHHIREVAPGKFKIFADALLEEYTKNGVSVEKLIEQKKQFLEEKGRLEGKTEEEAYDLAYEEVVADSAEAMLVDSNAIEALSRKIHEKDKGLWNTIKDFIAKLVARIKAAYKGLNPDSAEANYVRDMVDSADKLQKLWVDALLEASDMVAFDTSTESVSPMFSERTWSASEYVIHRDNMAEKISNALGVTITKAKSYIDDINSIAKIIADDRTRLDYEASSFGSAFVSNVEYGGSFDYTTLCKKRRIYTGTFSEIQKRLHDVALTPDDILKIRNLLIEEGIEATCGLCYVEGSRANMGKFAKEFIRLYKRDNPDAWIPTMADVNTPDGVEQMRINHPEAYESYEYFWNHYGKLKDSDKALFASQQKPKLYEARKEYKGEILEHFKGDSTVAKKNLNGGIRMQSFSDFEIVHLIDTMQVIMDMSTVGLAGQAYTKVPEFAMAFGNTGLKINLSLIAKGVDADGNLIFDDREGMPHETAFGLRKKYSKNVGTIIVIFTDEQLLAAMADPHIDFIIPFHRSQWKKGQYGAMGLPKGTKDYTFMQNEKLIKQTYHEYQGRMVKDKASNYMPNEYWDFSKSGKENAEAYLQMCAENNKRPKFYKLLDYDGNGTYSLKADGSTDGYWKLLIDFKMYDNDGVGSPQMAVTPTFNMDKARTMLDEYKGGHSKYPVASGVVDKFVSEYNKENKTKYSDRDSLDNYREKRYNLYTTTSDFNREVAYNDRHAFARSLAHQTSDMVDGEIRTIYIYSTSKVYVFRADGYMHGEMVNSVSGNDKQLMEDISYEYEQTDQGAKNADLWAEAVQSRKGGLRGDGLLPEGGRRSDTDDRLSDYTSESYTSRYTERERPTPPTKEEIDEIVQKLREMYGFDANNSDIRYSDRDSNGNELTAKQKEFFKDSKVRDANGNLLVLYHGTKNGGFTVFDAAYSDDRRSLFFTSSKKTAQSYGITGNIFGDRDFESRSPIKTIDDAKAYFDSIKWKVIEYKDGKYFDGKTLYQQWNKNIKYSLQNHQGHPKGNFNNEQELIDYAEREAQKSDSQKVKTGLYEVYLNLKNPLIVDAKGHSWNHIDFIPPELEPIVKKQKENLQKVGEKIKELRAYAQERGISLSEAMDRDREYARLGDEDVALQEEYDAFMEENGLSMDTSTRDISKYAKNHGYDGVLFKNIYDAGQYDIFGDAGMAEYIAVAFDSNQVKSTSNKKPTESNDFRYSDRNTASFKGKAFWSGSVSLLDGVIEEVHTMEEAEAVDFHHSMYFSPAQVEKMENGENAFFWVDDGKVQGDWRESVPKTIIKRIEEQIKVNYQDRNTDSYSNRSLLANALETAAQNDIERNKLKQYKQKIDLINAEEQKLHDLREQIKELSFKKGARDTEAIKHLQFEANQAANRINTYDRQLLNLESTKALKGVLEREKAQARKRAEKQGKEALERYREKAAKTQRELMDRYQESRKRATEGRNKTAMRHKIKDVVNELNNYLLKGTKDKHVPIELQKAVAEALDAVNMDTVGAEERIASLKSEMMRAKTPEAMQEIAKKIDHIEEMGGNMEAKISRLKTAYDSIINSEDPLVANSHDDVISNTISRVMEVVGDTSLRDMSLYQLEAVYDMYRMVLHSIRTANKAFKAKKSEEISVIANRVLEEIDKLGKKKALQTKAGNAMSNFDWNNQKPIYAFNRIGSDSFTEVFNNVRAGEDTWAVDMSEAREFLETQKKDHGYGSWDFNKRYDFTSSTGKNFSLSLGQIMSLYAYAKRGDQARDHLRNGGFVFDGLTEVKQKGKLGVTKTYQLKDSTAYNLTDEILSDITSKLSAEQKAFADVMQEYLSTTMGEKGNEVSLELYGVKLFKEKNYFPLKSAPQFLERAREQAQGETKIKNKGFTKETTPKAKNPIVLTSFMDVWAGHVNEMSMYHAFTLALEDFYRVYNYKTPASETMDSESVISFLENAHGNASVAYIDQLLKDLNGGARSDPRETLAKSLMSNFKKASVMASLSVVIQQPSAIVRAQALVDAKYFVGKKVSKGKHKETWAEVKKYAPVAIIKEMGYFDVGMGQSSTEWLKGEKSFMDKVDDVLSKAPALADELTWVAIWNAVKRETAHNNPSLQTSSEEFLKLAGERFTEVITKTQVYDSTLARSANMRSKSAFMSMWTAFLAEPTTSINMLQDAILKGNKKYIAKTVGAVVGSVILNSALVSIVYAMRDDDEDETFIEKYLSRFTTEVFDGINPLTYLPFFKDVWSVAQGFDVERADMSLITKMFDSLQQVIKVASKDTSGMSEEESAEHNKAVVESILSNVDNLSSLLGIPVKNLRRDLYGLINGVKTIIEDASGRETTAGSLGDNILEDLKDSVPVWGWLPGESKGDKLYDAIIKGDTAYLDRLKSGYKSESAYETAIRKALRENDPRIKEAAEARYAGDLSEYTRIAKEIIAEGNFKQDDVVAAINSEVSAIKKGETTEDEPEEEKDEATSIYSASDINAAFESGDNATAREIIADIVKTKVANGKTEKEAKSSIRSSMTSYWKPLYKKAYASGNSTEMARIRKILYASGLYGNANDVINDVAAWLKD